MIKVTRLNNSEFVINSHMIKFMESRPDTIITLVNEEKIVVREALEVVVQRVIEFERKVRIFER